MDGGQPGQDGLWLSCGLLYALGAAVPSLIGYNSALQIIQLPGWQRCAVVLGADLFFIACCIGFLYLAEAYGRQRHGKTARYPGPFRLDMNKEARVVPRYFRPWYMTWTYAGSALFMPMVVCLGMLLFQQDGLDLSGVTLLPYCVEFIAQIIMEGKMLREGSPVWPQVPQSFQTYRVIQLIRGIWFAHQLAAPQWLVWMQQYFLLLWVVNFGSVMCWHPWLYLWHLQQERPAKSS